MVSNRIDVKKTYKLFINGAFPRTESGRTYEVKSATGVFIANPCLASRKDLRDAVVAARAAHQGWDKDASVVRRPAVSRRGRSGFIIQWNLMVQARRQVETDRPARLLI